MEIFKLFGSIFVDTEAADKSMQKTEKKASNIATKFGEGVKTAAKWGTGVAKAAAGVVTAVSGAFVVVTETTRDYRNEMAKLETAFDSAGFSADEAKDIYRDLSAVLGETDQAVEAANHLAKLCNTQEELATWSEICTGVYATFGASLPIEGLTEAANETAKVGALTGSLADALNWAGVSEDEFQKKLDKCNTEQERQALITETLSELYKDTAESYRKNNEEVLKANEAQEKLNETMAKIGDKLEPVVSDIKLYGAALLDEVIPPVVSFIEEHDLVQVTLDGVKGAVDFLKEAIDFLNESYLNVIDSVDVLSDAWENACEWAEEHKTGLSVLAIMLGTLTTAVLAYNSAKIIKKALDIAETAQIWLMIAAENAHTIAITAATAATTAFSAVLAFLTSPVTAVIAIIGGLIAIGVALYQNWDIVSAKAKEMWEKLTTTFENIKQAATIIFDAIKNVVTDKINALKTNALNKFQEITNGIRDKINNAKDNVKNAIDKIKGFFNFEWSLPKLKMPHPYIRGSFSLNPPSVPSFGIDWYAKAMNDPIIMDSPTAFGINSLGQIMAGGEKGSEVVSGTDTLMRMIAAAVASQNADVISTLNTLLELLSAYLPALANMRIVLDSGATVGALAPGMNAALGKLAEKDDRGV